MRRCLPQLFDEERQISVTKRVTHFLPPVRRPASFSPHSNFALSSITQDLAEERDELSAAAEHAAAAAAAGTTTGHHLPVGVPLSRGHSGLLTPVPEGPLSPKSEGHNHWQEVAITSMCYCRDMRNLAACVGT